ncbi:MAG: chemotaxis protein CheX [Spirochaetales bacterium]
MTERELRVFIDVVVEYFRDVTGDPVEMGVPFVQEGRTKLLDHTGVIGISGAKRGGVLVTAGEQMLRELAAIILGSEELEPEDVVDMVGELTNTVAGNVRREFGSSFMISVPIVLEGKPSDIRFRLKPPIFVVPINWRDHRAYLSVGLEDGHVN